MRTLLKALRPVATVMVTAPLVVAFTSASAQSKPDGSAYTSVPYTCQTWLDGEQMDIDNYELDFEVTAPETVAPRSEYVTTFDPAPIYPVPQFNEELIDVHATYSLPWNAMIVNYWLVGGEVTDSVTRSGNQLTVHSPAPKAGGVEFDLPTLKVRLKAPRKGTLVSTPGGSGYHDLSFGWLRLHPDTQEWDAFECFVEPGDDIEFARTEVVRA